ncbi:MAG: hypothetical protein AAGF75_00700 [Cyanobacteria bacterium P01_H01_bin.130]
MSNLSGWFFQLSKEQQWNVRKAVYAVLQQEQGGSAPHQGQVLAESIELVDQEVLSLMDAIATRLSNPQEAKKCLTRLRLERALNPGDRPDPNPDVITIYPPGQMG